jgi:hypothetical protein
MRISFRPRTLATCSEHQQGGVRDVTEGDCVGCVLDVVNARLGAVMAERDEAIAQRDAFGQKVHQLSEELLDRCEDLAEWEERSTTHKYVAKLKAWPKHGNEHRLRVIEDAICLTCAGVQGACEHPRLHP